MDEQIDENYIKFRYDFVNDDEHPYSILALLFGGGHFAAGVLGVESQNAYGAAIKRHFHYHFMTKEKPETIRKRFTRNYPHQRGRGWYSLCQETDVKNIQHFFRYCIKQIEPINFKYEFNRVPIPKDFDLSQNNLLAYEEWSKGREILTKKAKEKDSRLSVYEKILDIIQETSPELFSLRDCKLYVLDYYMEHSIPPQKPKILDMANGIALRMGIVSKEAYLEL